MCCFPNIFMCQFGLSLLIEIWKLLLLMNLCIKIGFFNFTCIQLQTYNCYSCLVHPYMSSTTRVANIVFWKLREAFNVHVTAGDRPAQTRKKQAGWGALFPFLSWVKKYFAKYSQNSWILECLLVVLWWNVQKGLGFEHI